jgi:uncharacterized protein YukE
MSQWDEDTPSLGDAEAVGSATGILDDIAQRLTQLKDLLTGQANQVSDSIWQGESGCAFRDRAISVSSDLGLFTQWLGNIATAMSVYGTELASMQTVEKMIQTQLAGAHQAAATALRNSVTASTPAQRVSAATTQERERGKINACETQLAELADRRRTINSLLRADMSTGPGVAFISIGAVMVRAGHTPGQPLTSGQVSEALTALSEDILDRDADATTLAGMAELLRYACLDPDLADDFIRQIGGKDLTNIPYELDVLNESTSLHDSIVQVQSRLRTTFSVASAAWDRDRADAFNTALMQGTNAPLAVAYLYYDTGRAPMSQTMSQSLTDLIHTKEIQDGTPWVWNGGMTAMGEQMSEFITTFNGEHLVVADPAFSALVQIANDPAAALDWLTTTDNLDFWYDQRDWAHASGATAPAILWASTQHTPGALLAEQSDPDLVKKLAEANASIINHWAETVLKGDQYLSEKGCLALADLVKTQLPYWLETSIWETAKTGRKSALHNESSGIDWLGIEGGTCVISSEALIDLLRLISVSGAATQSTITGVESLSRLILGAAAGHTEASSYNEALQKIAALYGLVDGAGIAHDLSAAQHQDAIAQGWIDAGSFATGFLPGGVVKDSLVAGGAGWASSAWADTYATRVSELFDGTNPSDEELLTQRTTTLTDLAKEYFPPEILAQRLDGADGAGAEAAARYELDRYPGAMS